MDTASQTETERPVAQDALRLLLIVHQVGAPNSGEDTGARAATYQIDGERRLLLLDHLVRHPIDLAYLALDLLENHRGDTATPLPHLAAGIRRLLGAGRRRRHRQALLRPFDPGSWQRHDDAFAFLGCRGLLRIEPLAAGDLRFRLTQRGAAWLDSPAFPASSLASWKESCQLLRDVLPTALLQAQGAPSLDAYLQEAYQRFEAYRRDEQIALEDDLLAHLFHMTFLEPL